MLLGTKSFRIAQVTNSYVNLVTVRHQRSNNVLEFQVASNARKHPNRRYFVNHVVEGKTLYMGFVNGTKFIPGGEKARVNLDSPVGKVWSAFWERIAEGKPLPSTWEVTVEPLYKAKAPGRLKHR